MSKGLNTARLVLFLIAGAALTYYLLSLSGSPGETVRGIGKALADSEPLWLVTALVLFSLSQMIRPSAGSFSPTGTGSPSGKPFH